jgi:N-acetyl-anhydromuramyl-L-alanine amidase AmpD
VAQSPEYSDLKWVVPKSWTNANRTAVQLIVIHTTEGSAHSGSAEDGAAYDQRRTDGTSTHYFHDSDSTIQCVRTNDQAHTARGQGNRRGIHHELCGRAGTLDWEGAYATAMLRRTAKQAARDAEKWDIPVRHLTAAQVAAGAKGFCGHVDITRAFPADKGSHTDPGKNFPWTRFLDMVRAELAPAPSKEDDEMGFWASAAKAARGDADATATDRTNRNNAVQVIRFALGLPVDDQTTEALPAGSKGQLTRIETAVATIAAQTAPPPQ